MNRPYVLLLLCLACDDGGGAHTGDAATGAETPEARGVIGPAGGTLALGAITVRVPAGVLEEETEVRLVVEEAPAGPFLEVGFRRLGPAFRVVPPLAPIAIEAEVGTATARLVSISPGIHDSPHGARRGPVHIGRAPTGVDGGVARFHVAHTPSVWQVVVRGEVAAQGLRRSEPQEARSVPVPNSCAAALTAAGLPAIPGIDDRIILMADPLSLHASWRVDCGLQDDGIAPLAHRFAGRTCQAAWRALLHYEGPQALPVPPAPLLITLIWSKRHEPGEGAECAQDPAAAPVGTPRGELTPRPPSTRALAEPYDACDPLRPAEQVPYCDGALAYASGAGLDLFFNPLCKSPYAGCLAPEGDGGCDPIEWSSTGINTEATPDELEHTVAHELFHWIHDRTDPTLHDFPGPKFFTEGAADAAAEKVFDSVVSEPSPARIWSEPSWSACGLHPYRMHAFWRWLEARGAGDPARLFLDAVQATPGPWDSARGWSTLDAVFEATNGTGRVGALADFAVAWLVRHDFERPDAALPGDTGDASPDALGQTLAETTPGELWGPWDDGFEPDPDTPVPAALTTVEVGALPHVEGAQIPAYTARAFALEVAALDQNVRLRVSGRAGERISHVGVRLLEKPGESPSEIVWRRDELETAEETEAWSSTVLTRARLASTWWLVVANPLHHDLDLDLRLEAVPERVVAMTQAGVLELELRGDTLTPTGASISAPSDARGVLAVGGGRAILARRDGTVALVELEARREVDLDDDPATTTRGAPDGVTRFDLGAESRPEGAALTPDGRFALVSLRGPEEVVVLDLEGRRICKRGGVGRLPQEEAPQTLLLSPDGAQAWLSIPGLLRDPLREVARLDVADLRACDEHGGVRDRFLTGARRPGALALSGDGLLAVASRADAQIRVVDGQSGEPADLPWRGDPFFDAGQIPTALAWAPDNQRLYIGNLFGVEDTPLAGHGTVNVGERATGRDSYHVGVGGSVTGLVVSEDGQRVVVGDDLGHLTVLSVELWDGSAEHVRAPFNRSGGCWNERGSAPIPCPPTLTLEAPIEGLVRAR